MNRRAMLARTGSLAAAALAGCLSDPPADRDTPVGGGTGEDTPTDTPTPADTPTPENPTGTDAPATSPGVTDVSFEVLSVGPGDGEDSATVSFDDEVTVDGTAVGRNGCYTADLGSARRSDGTLTVVVEVYEDKGEDETCTQSLVDIDYVATVAFEESLPERVVVEHEAADGTVTVADVTR